MSSDEMKEFDCIILGTGLKECILSGLLSSVAGKKVFVVDRNSYYGGESASLNLEQLYKRFRGPDAKPAESLGRSRDFCVDLCPKFLMACGDLVKVLLLTKVTAYLEFKSVTGSYVFKSGKIHKVPSTGGEAFYSSLLTLFEKRRYKKFLTFVAEHGTEESTSKIAVEKMTGRELYEHFGLSTNTQNFTGHAMALHLTDEYLDGPALDLIERIKLYADSVTKYGNSPYIYPKWGLGGLPEGFSRRCAVHGGTFMLNMAELPFVEEILYHDNGKVSGVRFSEEVSKAYEIPREIQCKQLIADPSYFMGTDKVKTVGQVVRSICIMDQPVPNTKDSDSCQIIIPAVQVGRTNDIYVCMASYHHEIAAKGKYVAVMSTNVESKEPELELDAAMALLPPVEERFTWVTDTYVPTGDGSADNCFITRSYDATTHFQTTTKEVMELFARITGDRLDLENADYGEEGQ